MVHTESDWKLVGWGLEDPASRVVGPLEPAGVPAVQFADGSGTTVTIVLERTGSLREVRFAGQGLTVSGISRQVRVGSLVTDAIATVQDWITAYAASRPAAVREAEAEEMEWFKQAQVAGVQWPKPTVWALADMVEGFRRPAHVGGPKKSDAALAAVAQNYVASCVNGPDKVGSLARKLKYKPSTFSTWLALARKRGLLTGNPKRGGPPEGELTTKAKAILRNSVEGGPA